MAKKPTLTDVTNTYTAAPIINANNDKVEEAFENTLSRDGSTPNQMEADIDLNSNDLLNVGRLSAIELYVSGTDFTTAITDIQEVIGDAIDAAERAEAVGTFDSRADFVEWVSSNTPVDGRTYQAGGLSYRGEAGATDISDLLGVVPSADSVTPDHFGALADMTYTDLGADGPLRTGGTDNLTAFQAADEYAKANGIEVVVPAGQYFLDGSFEPTAVWKAASDFDTTIWSRYSVYTSGIWIKTSNAAWVGFKMIGQYDRQGVSKPANAGHIGNIVTINDFLTSAAQTPTEGVKVRVLLRRAHNGSGQVSNTSILCNGMSYVVNAEWEVGVWGEGSNVGSGALIQHHWGAQIDDGGAWDISMDPSIYDNIESYHPEGCSVTFIGGEIDAAAHGILTIWVRSATIDLYIGPCASTGAGRAMYDLAGDDNNTIAVAGQYGRVGLNNRTGLQQHLNCTPDADQRVYDLFSRGESKWATTAGGGFRQDQYRHSIFGEGMVLSSDGGSSIVRFLHASNDGKFDIGPLYLTANNAITETALYWQAGVGGSIDIQEANRAVHLRQSELDKLFLRTDLGPLGNVSPNGDFQLGYNSNNAGLVMETSRFTATVGAALNFGDTKITVSALPIGVHLGAKVYVNGKQLKTTRFASAGSTEIEIKPSPYTASISDPVVIVLMCGIEDLTAEISSSEYGIIMRGAYINNANLSGMDGQGRYAALLETHDGAFTSTSIPSFMRINGGTVPMIGRLNSESGVTGLYTFSVRTKCKMVLDGVTIPSNPHVTAHFQVARAGASGPWGRVEFNNCIIESPTTLVAATVNADSVSLNGCTDYNGEPVTIADL